MLPQRGGGKFEATLTKIYNCFVFLAPVFEVHPESPEQMSSVPQGVPGIIWKPPAFTLILHAPTDPGASPDPAF